MRSALAAGDVAEVHPGDFEPWRAPLLRLYEQRRFAPLWFAGRRLTPAGTALLQELSTAQRRGLRPRDYDASGLADSSARLAADSAGSYEQTMLLDVAFSVAATRLASDLHYGRVTSAEMGYELDVPRPAIDVGAVLSALAGTSDVSKVLDGLEPPFIHYGLLKAALRRYRSLALMPRLTELPPLPAGRSLRSGDAYSGVQALRRLLAALGDLPDTDASPGGSDDVLDPELAAGLRRYQARHGLAVDGVLGVQTYRALTTPFEQRVSQIELSLERWRWLPPKLDTPPIIVNIPEFRLFAFYTLRDEESTLLKMNVVVGKSFPWTQTPVFAADMRYIVLNPYWDVPYSILKRELLPQIRGDSHWVEHNGYEIVRGWGDDDAVVVPQSPASVAALAAGRLRLRQRPGPANALGFAKFMLPNRHNVYLHASPEGALFSRARRAFSHGCVRVAAPLDLLDYVLRSNAGWQREGVQAAIRSGRTIRISLASPIRVFVLYATAIAAEDGRTLFFDDIYGEDERLSALLDARSTR